MSLVKSAFTELWRHFAAWFVFYNVAMISLGYIAFTKSPLYNFLPTFILPYGMFLLYYWARLKSDNNIEPTLKKQIFLRLLTGTLAIIVLIIAFARHTSLGTDWHSHTSSFKWGYEFTNITFTILLAIHCIYHRGWKELLLFFGTAAIYGISLENTGVIMGYFFEDRYHLYLPFLSAPAVTMFGWCTVFYPMVLFLEMYSEIFSFLKNGGFILRGLVITILAIIFDSHIDPFATQMGLWRWNEIYTADNTLYWFEVPAINFTSWFGAVFSFGVFYSYIMEKLAHLDVLKRVGIITLCLPLMLAFSGIVCFLIIGTIEGFTGPSFALLEDYYNAGMPLFRHPLH